jgi:hypothetical protein
MHAEFWWDDPLESSRLELNCFRQLHIIYAEASSEDVLQALSMYGFSLLFSIRSVCFSLSRQIV